MTDVLRDLPIDDRPRERLLEHGPETMSDAELLALVLGSGVKGKNAIQLAREVLSGGMASLRRRTPDELCKTPGIGPAKAARIGALVELVNRFNTCRPDETPTYVGTAFGPKLVAKYARYTQERLGALFLDSRLHILQQREIFVGTVDATLVSTRDIIRFAVTENATRVVLYHNHPSGNPSPSAEDVEFTRKLRESLRNCDIELVDHLVLGAHAYHSMAASWKS
jgi:DNA repair protein RadC